MLPSRRIDAAAAMLIFYAMLLFARGLPIYAAVWRQLLLRGAIIAARERRSCCATARYCLYVTRHYFVLYMRYAMRSRVYMMPYADDDRHA